MTSAIGMIVALVLMLFLAVIAVLNSNLLRPTLEHVISGKTGRETKINGDLRAHLLSWTPTFEIGGITVKNPPWAEQSILFSADQLKMSVSLGRLLRGQILLPQVALIKPVNPRLRSARCRNRSGRRGRPPRPAHCRV